MQNKKNLHFLDCFKQVQYGNNVMNINVKNVIIIKKQNKQMREK